MGLHLDSFMTLICFINLLRRKLLNSFVCFFFGRFIVPFSRTAINQREHFRPNNQEVMDDIRLPIPFLSSI